MADVRFDSEPYVVYTELEKRVSSDLLAGIDDALDLLEEDPGDARVRRRSFRDGLWGIPVRDRIDDWLIVWEFHDTMPDAVVIRYLGTDPFA
ncbi:hypothetical protein [Planomonospora venezuelensis]|uniref:Type II toxin-antitoxin system RelE/ParE family toxin n=1 Tax=Planomonospora venezuelensis TaxID=1999 RepID=A0A841D3L3_PLAVE|nr:hypothetical protein [Planomonospora venezuelensis]MBB5962978.1 hypothetical protein [Planomonospora venezuelensis]GIN00546.1 hypothetical protein Pve01_22040 [Planomonospora venezuelensis]